LIYQVDGEKSGAERQFRERVSLVAIRVVIFLEWNDEAFPDFRQHVDEDGGQKNPTSDAHDSGHEVFEEFHLTFLHELAQQEGHEAADQFDHAEADQDDDLHSDEVDHVWALVFRRFVVGFIRKTGNAKVNVVKNDNKLLFLH